MISINLLFCCEEVLVHRNVWMTVKTLGPITTWERRYLKSPKHVTDVDYIQPERVREDLRQNKLGEYPYLFDQNDTLLLADVFNNFSKMYLKIYALILLFSKS